MSAFDELIPILEAQNRVYHAVEITPEGVREKVLLPTAGAHNCYSISKSVTGCGIGILENEGKLKDTDPVMKYLEEFFPAGYDKKWEEVTIRDVMLHKTGWEDDANIDIDTMDFWKQGREDFLLHALSQPIIHEPGKGPFIYTDTNYYMIGRIIEKVTGVTAGAFLHERMFNPMHFRGHAWGVCPKGHTIGGSGLFLRTKDLARYCYMLACDGEYEGKQILTPEWIEKARGEKGGYGYGFHNSGDGRWFATFGMYAQCGFVFPSTKSALAIHGHDVIRDEIDAKIIPQYL